MGLTGAQATGSTNFAEAGTLSMEFSALSHATGEPRRAPPPRLPRLPADSPQHGQRQHGRGAGRVVVVAAEAWWSICEGWVGAALCAPCAGIPLFRDMTMLFWVAIQSMPTSDGLYCTSFDGDLLR